jgi:hypothetical protein
MYATHDRRFIGIEPILFPDPVPTRVWVSGAFCSIHLADVRVPRMKASYVVGLEHFS